MSLNLTSPVLTVEGWLNESTVAILSEWQKSQLAGMSSEAGAQCLVNMWFNYNNTITQGSCW